MDKNKSAVTIFNKFAQLYQNKYMDTSMYHSSFDFFCDKISSTNPTILELSCGPGNITQFLLKKRPDFKITATDLAPSMIELAKQNNPEAEFLLLDCRKILSLKKKFDGILCGFGLPYLSKEECIQLISDASTALNPNGVLYLSTMEDDYSKSGIKKGSTGDEMYQYFHQEDYLLAALNNSGFKSIETQRVKTVQPDKSIVTDLILIAQK